jgi:membrane-associated phospholipid phosphatase
VREEETRVRRRPAPAVGLRSAPPRPAGWWLDIVALTAFLAVTVGVARGDLTGLDLAVRQWVLDHQVVGVRPVALVLNYLGQGGSVLIPVSVALAGWLGWRTRSVRPLLLVAVATVVMYVAVGPIKIVTDRDAPSSALPPEQAVLIFSDLPLAYDMSYPSGHVVNTVLWYAVIAVLLTAVLGGRLDPLPRRLIRIVPPVVVLLTTTYLNHHWLTDGLAGLLLGVVLARTLMRVPWDTVPLPFGLR